LREAGGEFVRVHEVNTQACSEAVGCAGK
jgi:hypothetical protein